MFFDQASIESLAESFEEIGVLVPITVYEDVSDDGTTHVLLDGERRWRAAKEINYPAIPAWVISKPDGVDNVLRMFNIHMLRKDWDEIATMWALELLQKQLNTDDIPVLAHRTGLSRDRIRNMQTVMSFPRKLQEAVARGDIAFQYLVELEKDILSKVRRHPEILPNTPVEDVRKAFLRKYADGVTETVELRKVGKLLATAKMGGPIGARAQLALENLIQDPAATVEEAYEVGAASVVELGRVLRDMKELPDRIQLLVESELTREQRTSLEQSISLLSTALRKIEHRK